MINYCKDERFKGGRELGCLMELYNVNINLRWPARVYSVVIIIRKPSKEATFSVLAEEIGQTPCGARRMNGKSQGISAGGVMGRSSNE